jgi:hypothetical protein
MVSEQLFTRLPGKRSFNIHVCTLLVLQSARIHFSFKFFFSEFPLRKCIPAKFLTQPRLIKNYSRCRESNCQISPVLYSQQYIEKIFKLLVDVGACFRAFRWSTVQQPIEHIVFYIFPATKARKFKITIARELLAHAFVNRYIVNRYQIKWLFGK